MPKEKSITIKEIGEIDQIIIEPNEQEDEEEEEDTS